MIQPSDIHTLTEFKRNSTDHIERLEDSGRPQVLTVDGRPKVVIMGVKAFEQLAELADRAAALDGIRKGLDDVDAGRHMSLEEFARTLRAKLPARRRGDPPIG